MFYFLSKTLFYFLMPITWILSLMVISLFAKGLIIKRRTLIAAIVLLVVFGNEFLINQWASFWEIQPIPYDQINKTYDYGVVLTGVAIYKKPDDRVYFSKGADRVTHAIQLYKLGLIKKVLITGGKAGIIEYGPAEADQLKKVFLLAGVPDSSIVVENKAKNTFENAQFTAELLAKINKSKPTLLLITSAFHMRRAQGCFDKANLPVDIFPVDYYSHELVYSDLLPVPKEGAFAKWSLFIHELIGFITYKLTGKC